MRSHTEPLVLRYEGTDLDWSLTDQGLLSMGAMAREVDLNVVIIPTLADFTDGHWRGEVRMADEASWAAWFRSYREFVIHYAELAEAMTAKGFSVGTELRETVNREDDWRITIAQVRQRFGGWLTYAANWDDYESVPWWTQLDLIGVQAYFEVGNPGGGSAAAQVGALVRGWAPIRERLARLSEATGKRVLFTEIGYKSHTESTTFPWNWEIEGAPDPGLQAVAYEAAFKVFWNQPWFAGFYWWKWRPDPAADEDYERDFTPQGKLAEQVLRQYYSTAAHSHP
jgi:hypothetical protein